MGKGAGCFPSKGSKFVGAGSETPHERLETGPPSEAKALQTNDASAPAAAASAAAPADVKATPPPAVENSAPAPGVEKSADDDQPVKTFESATPVASTKVKVFIV